MDKFFSRRPTFCAALLARPIGHAKNWWSKPKCTLDPDQLKTLLYVLFYLNRTWSFHFKCVSIKSFYSILKIKSATEALITICRNLSKQTFLGAAADSWLKNGKRWLNDPILYLSPSLNTSIWILRTVTYPAAKTLPGPSQPTKISLFARIVDIFNVTIYFCQKYHLGCLRGSDYTADVF